MTDSSALIAAHFDELDHELRRHGAGVGLAEIHGMTCALLCRGRKSARTEDWTLLIGESAANANIQRVLRSIFSASFGTLDSDAFEFEPLLPADDVPISLRIESVSDWCSGFMQAYLAVDGESGSGTVAEAVDDISAIAEIVPDDSDIETQRRNLADVVEHLRVATQLIFDNRAPVKQA
ncbi:MAG: hypothetical protein DWQ08_09870 [Proteobacteria bacterium]|nr:MAG: hypothetical protein DWQ08_09870 [Pseudomonadota bacterium]